MKYITFDKNLHKILKNITSPKPFNIGFVLIPCFYRIETLPNLCNSCVNFLPQSPKSKPFSIPNHLQFCQLNFSFTLSKVVLSLLKISFIQGKWCLSYCLYKHTKHISKSSFSKQKNRTKSVPTLH